MNEMSEDGVEPSFLDSQSSVIPLYYSNLFHIICFNLKSFFTRPTKFSIIRLIGQLKKLLIIFSKIVAIFFNLKSTKQFKLEE